MSKRIKIGGWLGKGLHATVDDDDYKRVSQYFWSIGGNTTGQTRYAITWLGVGRKRQLMHNMILPKKKGIEIDHINGNGLDNRKANLRYCTHQQNAWFRIRKQRCKSGRYTSKYPGVSWHKRDNIWKAYIGCFGRRIHLGSFKSERAAWAEYKRAHEYRLQNNSMIGYPLLREADELLKKEG